MAWITLFVSCGKSEATPENPKEFKTSDFEVTLTNLEVDGQLFADFNVKNLKNIDYDGSAENGSFRILGKANTTDGELYEGDTPVPKMSAGASATTFTLVISFPEGKVIDQNTFTFEVLKRD